MGVKIASLYVIMREIDMHCDYEERELAGVGALAIFICRLSLGRLYGG